MEISDSGSTTVLDQMSKKQVTIQLSDGDIANMAGLLAGVVQLQPVSRLPACADCYLYSLDAIVDVKHFSFQVNDIDLNDSGLAPLVHALMDLQDRILAGQLK